MKRKPVVIRVVLDERFWQLQRLQEYLVMLWLLDILVMMCLGFKAIWDWVKL